MPYNELDSVLEEEEDAEKEEEEQANVHHLAVHSQRNSYGNEIELIRV